MTATVTLLSDFVDGTSMALMEETDTLDLNAFMTANQGRLWGDVQRKRRDRGLTTKRRGPGTLYYCANQTGLNALQKYLQAITGSADEAHWMSQMQQAGVQIAPHIGASGERSKLLDEQQQQRGSGPARGFGAP